MNRKCAKIKEKVSTPWVEPPSQSSPIFNKVQQDLPGHAKRFKGVKLGGKSKGLATLLSLSILNTLISSLIYP